MKDQIRIILIGDTGTGKSSVITSYISKYFPNEVPAVLVDAIIPIDSTANNVSVTIMDSSALLGDRDVLHQKIRMADSIISLYDVTRPETIDSLEELWLPTIRDICSPYPVSKAVHVVGNKTDLVGSDEEKVETVRMKKIVKDFPFVVATYRCSAKLVDVDQIFYESELAVTSEFTSACKVAFLRIFRCVDLDQDGLLSDEELNSLQQQSFGIPLKDEEVTALKQEIRKHEPGGMMNESITYKGLMGIMRLFIYRCLPLFFSLYLTLPCLMVSYLILSYLTSHRISYLI
jgi:mitochondrial Rho GTPase 1